MISTLEKEITFRYLKTRKKDGFLNIISIFSFIGISLGVAVLIIVMSVMNGFRTELINKIVGFNAHVTVKPYEKPIDKEKLNENKIQAIIEEYLFANQITSLNEKVDDALLERETLLIRKKTVKRVIEKIMSFIETFVDDLAA